ncbi:MAG TPA: GntR family transcriptional regulator [Micromonosporaceae bacterium]|nr:GntR family transcriptional regulator [Micromonosporaceae bacterium]
MPTPGRPKYRTLADELRGRILSGRLAPGTPVPSETELMRVHAVSRNTVRLAVGLLRAEGLIVTRHGRGSYVRPRLPVRRIASERYRRELEQIDGTAEPATSFTADQQINWAAYRLDREFREVPATAGVAELLELPPGTPLLERRFVFFAGNRAQQMSYSYYELALVSGTPIADPANEPWPGGNIAQLATIGIRVTEVHERIRARMPVPDETELLDIAPGVPVLTITRVMLAGDRPVEAAVDIVIPADRCELDYRIPLD